MISENLLGLQWQGNYLNHSVPVPKKPQAGGLSQRFMYLIGTYARMVMNMNCINSLFFKSTTLNLSQAKAEAFPPCMGTVADRIRLEVNG